MTEAEKKGVLKKHKAIATGLFVFMAFVYALMVYLGTQNEGKWIGYVESFAEAAMVGALADWFAVTALFKYPLGLKIPHTNLIENSKNSIGDNLGHFVKDNFLTPQNIRPYIAQLDVVKFASTWIIQPANQHLLQEELLEFVKKVINDLEDKEVADFLALKGTEVLKQFDVQALAASTMTYIIDKRKHEEIIDALLPKAMAYIKESDVLIKDKINEKHPVISFFAGKRISKGVVQGVISFLEEVEQDTEHPIRANLEEKLREITTKINQSPEWKLKLETIRDEFITPEKLHEYANDLWVNLKTNLLESFDEKDSLLQVYVQKNIQKLAVNLQENQDLIHRINGWIRHFLYRTILRNVSEVETLISNTVGDWEGKELSEKLELEVGKDLQYIRINGTLVGGLVGLVIYTLTQLFFH